MDAADQNGTAAYCCSHPSCWICLEEGPDESGKLPVRDCSCRGTDAGFAHLSCLVAYAKGKAKRLDGQNIDTFEAPWITCPRCMQFYQGKLALDLADEYISYVRIDYPGGNERILAALEYKLYVLSSTSNRIQPDLNQKAQETADEFFSMLGDIKSSSPSLPPLVYHFEANAYNNLGAINSSSGTKEGAKAALEYYEKCLAIAKEREIAYTIGLAEYNMASVKSRYGLGSKMTKEQLLRIHQKAYRQAVQRDGESSGYAIIAGENLVIALKKAHHDDEAKRLSKKILAISKRVHGEEHDLAKHVASAMKRHGIYDIECRDELLSQIYGIQGRDEQLFQILAAMWLAFALFHVLL